MHGPMNVKIDTRYLLHDTAVVVLSLGGCTSISYQRLATQ